MTINVLTEEERECLRTILKKLGDASGDELLTELLKLLEGADGEERKSLIKLFIKVREFLS